MARIKKLAMNINAFDASELLEPMITEIRDQVDEINLIWQKKSYWKNPIAKDDLAEINRLKDIGLVDNLIEFKPNFAKYSREQETDKRNMGIENVRSRGFSHVISTDADEFYDSEQFRYGKDMINKKGYNITYCSYVNYYRDFDHYLVYPFRPLVNFINSTFFTFKYQGPAPGPTDPTRRINNPYNLGSYVFEDKELRMGHASWIRKDIRKKLVNWSAKNHFDKKLIDRAVERWNTWKEGDDAVMLFKVPDNSVKVNKLEKRIHDFEVPWLKKGIF